MSEDKTNTILALSALLDKAKLLPTKSGCYLMYNKYGEIIYIGKALNLKNRVQSYFNKSAKSPKTQILVRHIKDFDFILTKNETESFILENNLIKKHLPKYNIRLRDDKTYPYISVNFNESFPRLEYTRRPKRKKGIEIFGPFPVGSNISQILKTLTKTFELRDCSLSEFRSRKEPCILYQFKQCSAPCVQKISAEDYQKSLELSLSFFKSKNKRQKMFENLTEKMMDEAKLEHFERAAFLRDSIEFLDQLKQDLYGQNVELNQNLNADIFAFYEGDEEIDMSVYIIKDGSLLGQRNFHFKKDDFEFFDQDEKALLVIQYYSNISEAAPDKVFLDLDKEILSKIEVALKEVLEAKIKVKTVPAKLADISESVLKHAQESQRVRKENKESPYLGLEKLKQLLQIKDRPSVLECYDIAIWQGDSPTGAQIVSSNGVLERSRYRHYHLAKREEGNNDFAMMEELLDRRLEKGHLPDLFIIDGGLGQVNAVKKSLKKKQIDIPVIGIAKAKNNARTEERLIIPGRMNPYLLRKCPPLMRIIVSMRDEAHRFSRRLHHKAENKRIIKTWIDDIKGISIQDRKEIMRLTVLSEDDLSKLTFTELEKQYPIDQKVLKKIHQYFNSKYE